MEVTQPETKLFMWLIGSLVIWYVINRLLPFSWRSFTWVEVVPDYLYNLLLRISTHRTSAPVFISDPRALQEILVKEHGTIFTHPPGHLEINNLIFGPGLFGISGITHKLQRKALNPVFTSFHTKSMSSKMEAVAHELVDTMITAMDDLDMKEINILEWCKSVTLETIGQAGFGYSFGAIKGSDSPYINTMRNFVPTVAPLFRFRWYIGHIFHLFPRGMWRTMVNWTPNNCAHRLNRMIDVQVKYSNDILESEMATDSSRVHGELDNILSTLIQINTHAREEDQLSEDQLRGQISTFLFAGFETTSSSLARTVHLLAEHPHVQQQLRKEIQDADMDLCGYDKLPYLDAIVRETLRLYPPVPTIERYASEDWVLPLRYPSRENKQEIYIKKGTRLLLSLSSANRCKETWGNDAEEFRPDRWMTLLPQSVCQAKIPGVYSSMMTFAAGPRSCIGYKFAVLELKIMLARLVETFQFSPGLQPIEWRNLGCMSPHVTHTREDGAVVLNEVPSLPLVISTLR